MCCHGHLILFSSHFYLLWDALVTVEWQRWHTIEICWTGQLCSDIFLRTIIIIVMKRFSLFVRHTTVTVLVSQPPHSSSFSISTSHHSTRRLPISWLPHPSPHLFSLSVHEAVSCQIVKLQLHLNPVGTCPPAFLCPPVSLNTPHWTGCFVCFWVLPRLPHTHQLWQKVNFWGAIMGLKFSQTALHMSPPRCTSCLPLCCIFITCKESDIVH